MHKKVRIRQFVWEKLEKCENWGNVTSENVRHTKKLTRSGKLRDPSSEQHLSAVRPLRCGLVRVRCLLDTLQF